MTPPTMGPMGVFDEDEDVVVLLGSGLRAPGLDGVEPGADPVGEPEMNDIVPAPFVDWTLLVDAVVPDDVPPEETVGGGDDSDAANVLFLR